VKAADLPPNLRKQLDAGRARPSKARTLATDPEPGGVNHWTCVPCGVVFTQWGGKGGVETHVTEAHGGGRIALDVGGAP